MSITKEYKTPSPGDLIRDCFDNELGLVISPPRYYNYNMRHGDPEDLLEYVLVQWPSYESPAPCSVAAFRRGDIKIIGEDE
jgi:hypothetical protein